jgi:hypothetical protein
VVVLVVQGRAPLGEDGHGRQWVPLFDDERVPEEEIRAQSIGAAEDDRARRERWHTLGGWGGWVGGWVGMCI